MNHIQELFTILAEECAETAQRASKAIRFTPEEVQSGQTLTNAERVVYEFNDIYATMLALKEAGAIDKVVDLPSVKLKMEKLKKYSAY